MYSPSRSFCRQADIVVDQHSQDQHNTQEDIIPIGIDTRIDDALAYHAKDQRTQRRANRGAIAAREQVAADDRGDDGARYRRT